jgi:hypothetical protein
MLRIGLEPESVVLVVIYASEYCVDPAALLGYHSISNCALYLREAGQDVFSST